MFLHKISLVHRLPGPREKMKFFSTHGFLEEASFHLDGTVNKQNMQF